MKSLSFFAIILACSCMHQPDTGSTSQGGARPPLVFNYYSSLIEHNILHEKVAEYYVHHDKVVFNQLDTFHLISATCCEKIFENSRSADLRGNRLTMFSDTAIIIGEQGSVLLTLRPQLIDTIDYVAGINSSGGDVEYGGPQYVVTAGDFLIHPPSCYVNERLITLYTDIQNKWVGEALITPSDSLRWNFCIARNNKELQYGVFDADDGSFKKVGVFLISKKI